MRVRTVKFEILCSDIPTFSGTGRMTFVLFKSLFDSQSVAHRNYSAVNKIQHMMEQCRRSTNDELAARSTNDDSTTKSIALDQDLSHHNRYQYCTKRLKYRDGRRLTAVKVKIGFQISKHARMPLFLNWYGRFAGLYIGRWVQASIDIRCAENKFEKRSEAAIRKVWHHWVHSIGIDRNFHQQNRCELSNSFWFT